jgi:hypothetical protein
LIPDGDEPEPRSSRIALVAWSATVVVATVALDQVFFATIPSNATVALTALFVLVVGAPFALGVIGGALIRVRQPMREVFLLAALGAGCLFVVLDVSWNAIPAACSEPTGCDIALGFGAAVFAIGSYVAFLAGAVIARFAVIRHARGSDNG